MGRLPFAKTAAARDRTHARLCRKLERDEPAARTLAATRPRIRVRRSLSCAARARGAGYASQAHTERFLRAAVRRPVDSSATRLLAPERTRVSRQGRGIRPVATAGLGLPPCRQE